MIFRRKLLQIGAKRTVARRAWLPRAFDYDGERVWVWLDQIQVEQTYGGCGNTSYLHTFCRRCWTTNRVLLLSDACLEKLNPKPEVLSQTQAASGPFGISSAQYQMQSTNLASLGGFGGMLSQGFRPGGSCTKKAGTP